MKGEYYVGLISGTSIDAVDAALIELRADSVSLLAAHSHPIPAALQQDLHALCRPGDNELERMAICDAKVARLFADATGELLRQAEIEPRQVRAIGSHGQTIRHFPQAHIRQSVQIGDPSLIAARTGITTVADFRRRDMAEGGEGAPLVPAFHRAMFGDPGEDRAIVNIGGIANITTLPGAPGSRVLGFDTGPGNTLLDLWARRHLGVPMDEDGVWAAGGRPDPELLAALLDEPYFAQAPPKSTGRELFNAGWLQAGLGRVRREPAPQDVAATLVELSVRSIADGVHDTMPGVQAVYVCGGGADNGYLMSRLQAVLAPVPVTSSASLGIPPGWVEAMAFGWLAGRTLAGLPGNLPDVTGAGREAILGGIYPA